MSHIGNHYQGHQMNDHQRLFASIISIMLTVVVWGLFIMYKLDSIQTEILHIEEKIQELLPEE